MKRLSVSVGIPAYNEEKNIGKLISKLLKQKGENFVLKEIIVVSDCSSDNTDKIVKSFKDKKVKLLRNKQRLGQALGQNKILDTFKGDALVLLNSDVIPANDSMISEAVAVLTGKKDIGIVGIDLEPVKAPNFFSNVIRFSVLVKNKIAHKWNGGSNLYLCKGMARVFSKKFTQKLRWPKLTSEDSYSYLYCITHGYKFEPAPNSKALYASPTNFTDHKKQSARFMSSPEEMKQYFPSSLVNQSYAIPKSISLPITLISMISNPVLGFSYAIILILVSLSPNKTDYLKPVWDRSLSTLQVTK